MTTDSEILEPDSAEEDFIPQWGITAPKGAKAVLTRAIKDGAVVPLFFGQTLIHSLRDLGYDNTTSAICEHVDNAIQWGATEVRVYFADHRGRGSKAIDVLVLDNGCGMSPNVLRAAMAFGGSMCFENRTTIGRYGVGMKAAALSIAPVLDVYSWQERAAYYSMTLDVAEVSQQTRGVVQLPAPDLFDQVPREIAEILTTPMDHPKDRNDQDMLADSPDQLTERLGESGTIVYMPACDRLTYRKTKTLVDHTIKTMARVYRRFLSEGLALYVNNRRVETFDPMYQIANARHASIPELQDKERFSRLVRSWSIPIPIEEGSSVTQEAAVRLYFLPIHVWDPLPRKVLKNDLGIFDTSGVSFMRNRREVHMGFVQSIVGKRNTRDSWWRLEIEFPSTLDEAMGVAVNKQGVRPKNFVSDLIKEQIQEELRQVKKEVDKYWAAKSTAQGETRLSEAERRANEAEAFQSTLLQEPTPHSDEEQRLLDEGLRTLACAYRRDSEDEDTALARIKESRFITTFKHDDDAAFYRVDFKLGKIILTVNTAHPFYEKLYQPLSALSTRAIDLSGGAEDVEVDGEIVGNCGEALVAVQLLLMSLARTQSVMSSNDKHGDAQKVFDSMRRQWSLDLATQLSNL